MEKYLVTGGAGFIGSHIAETLIAKGHPVRIADNLATGRRENIAFLKEMNGDLEYMEGDLSDPKVAQKVVQGVDTVFHQAALGSVPKSVVDPRSSHHANVTATVELLIAAKDEKVKSFVVAASSSAYGETPELPKRESMIPGPLSPYAVTKLAQEQYCQAFSASYGMRTVSLRYFNVYGPRQDPNSQYAAVIPKFFAAFLKNKSPEIYGDGEQTRDFTFIGDVVSANLKAAEFEDARGQVFNIAGGKAISINQLATEIARLCGSNQKPTHLAPRVGDIRHSLADIALARKNIGFEPKTNLEDGLKACLEWYRKN